MMRTKSLLLIWRDKETSKYFHVGTLTHSGTTYIFEYTNKSEGPRKVKDALEHGYRLLPSFPDLQKIYKSTDLYPTFHRRIPSKDRVDYTEILADLQLDEDADRMDILGKTRGIMVGDPYSFEKPLSLNEKTGLLSTSFYISGMRYRNLPDNWDELVALNEPIRAVHKPVPFDENAIQLRTKENLFLGYVPAIYSQAIRSLLERNIPLSFIVNEKRPTFDERWWAHVTFKAHIVLNYMDDKQQLNLDDLIVLVA